MALSPEVPLFTSGTVTYWNKNDLMLDCGEPQCQETDVSDLGCYEMCSTWEGEHQNFQQVQKIQDLQM